MLLALGAMGAMSLLSTFSQRGQAKAQNIMIRAQREADKMINDGQNQLGAAQGNFQRVAQSLNTRRMLANAGEQFDASSSNINRMLDDFTRGGLSRQLQASEELGALAAQAAFTGTGGGTQEMINRTAMLRSAVAEESIQTAQGLAKYDAHMQKASIMSSAMEGVDVSPVMTSMNYVLPQRAEVQGPSYVAGLLSTAVNNVGMLSNIGMPKSQAPKFDAYGDSGNKLFGGTQQFSWGANLKI